MTTEETKTCARCRAERPLERYASAPALPGGLSDVCVYCRRQDAAPARVEPLALAPRRERPVPARSATKPKWEDLRATELIDTSRLEGKDPRVLVVNTYAGSLLLGARQQGADVIAALEDCGFGSQWQSVNFPDMRGRLVGHKSGWPDLDLREVVVLAHPPCAAFSIQSKGTLLRSGKQGLNSAHFDETRFVLNYALGKQCLAIAVESVPGALEGGREEHDRLAEEHGYHLYRLLQNAATFGVPQWRPRFWAVFVRKDVGNRFHVSHVPRCVSLRQTLEGVDPGEPDTEMDRRLEAQIGALRDAGLDPATLLSEPGMLARNIQKHHGPAKGMDLGDVAGTWCVGANTGNGKAGRPGASIKIGYRFISKTPRILDPDGLSAVIIGDSWFVYEGRNVSPAEYRAIMGFPRDYILDHEYRMWLSKGVVPAVAAWVLEQVQRNVTGVAAPGAGVKTISPGGVADFRVTREVWERLQKGESVRDPFGHEPAEKKIDPNLFKKPRAAELLGKNAVVVLDDADDNPLADLVGDADLVSCELVTSEPEPEKKRTAPRKRRESLTAADWAKLEATGMAWELYPEGPPAQFASEITIEKRGSKKRVTGSYVLDVSADVPLADVAEAFEPKRVLVIPPLARLERCDGGVLAVLQYEPPNAGGNRNDIDRMAVRAAGKLGVGWRRA